MESGIHLVADRSRAWTQHLWLRYIHGRNYRHRLDPYYEKDFLNNLWSRRQYANMDHSNDIEPYDSDNSMVSCTETDISRGLELERDDDDERSEFSIEWAVLPGE